VTWAKTLELREFHAGKEMFQRRGIAPARSKWRRHLVGAVHISGASRSYRLARTSTRKTPTNRGSVATPSAGIRRANLRQRTVHSQTICCYCCDTADARGDILRIGTDKLLRQLPIRGGLLPIRFLRAGRRTLINRSLCFFDSVLYTRQDHQLPGGSSSQFQSPRKLAP
jgi:hypothetical protein